MCADRRPSRRKRRFWRWFRAIPITLMALTLAASLALTVAPVRIVRDLFFPVSHAEELRASCARHGVDPYLAAAVVKCESNWDEGAVSSAGALGLMQVMPETAQTLASWGLVDAQAYSPDNLLDPATNIEYGCAFLGYLSGQLSSQEEVVAAYNAGLGSVQEWTASGDDIRDAIQFAETRIYLERVMLAYEGYRRAYPEGI